MYFFPAFMYKYNQKIKSTPSETIASKWPVRSSKALQNYLPCSTTHWRLPHSSPVSGQWWSAGHQCKEVDTQKNSLQGQWSWRVVAVPFQQFTGHNFSSSAKPSASTKDLCDAFNYQYSHNILKELFSPITDVKWRQAYSHKGHFNDTHWNAHSLLGDLVFLSFSFAFPFPNLWNPSVFLIPS